MGEEEREGVEDVGEIGGEEEGAGEEDEDEDEEVQGGGRGVVVAEMRRMRGGFGFRVNGGRRGTGGGGRGHRGGDGRQCKVVVVLVHHTRTEPHLVYYILFYFIYMQVWF